MIVRVLTARVKPHRAGEFNALLRRQVPILREQPGLRYVKLARQAHADGEDVILFEEWENAASLYQWAGPDLSRPRLLPGTEEHIDSLEIRHYEALDIDLE
jgi:heme-degrading monooxygenase HmoA